MTYYQYFDGPRVETIDVVDDGGINASRVALRSNHVGSTLVSLFDELGTREEVDRLTDEKIRAHLDESSDHIIREAERDILVLEAHIVSKRALIKMVRESDAKRGRTK